MLDFQMTSWLSGLPGDSQASEPTWKRLFSVNGPSLECRERERLLSSL